ncbi:glycine--tRNA ligase subunit beta [Helicobacter sp. 13S00477-4]|uniref:glycine--tRNA ligase subunit beta n=1 Tax=Helicobacter sp. 13S00477-4 TaxID=1905759 RepID=UPI000BD26DA5|nr:glycine--tRNA ligase subunit beta [Helicobacter sp. 13S00477-4]PAF52012.1 glycine--tRNA ligase subunit beta [Helicobacter sp. 13S00477-4]
MDTQDLLVEILVEELPALPFLREFCNIEKKWKSIVKNHNLFSEPEIFYTPRRIVIIDSKFPICTQSVLEEFFGPPVGIAYIDGDIKNGLNKAGESFCKKCNIAAGELKTISKDKKEILYFSREVQGVEAKGILSQIVLEFLRSLNFGKSMRWGCVKESFIRPIRNICILFGGEHVPIEAYGFKGKRATKVHTDKGFDWKEFCSISEYFEVLKNGDVILSQKERKEKILKEISEIEEQKNIQVEIDEVLLNEIIAITEYPRALYGEFEEKFLQLPQEVIITSMKENQRYFATRKNAQLHYGFVVVSNSTASETQKIITGNQKVLRARLWDAMFFYDNDLKTGLRVENLDMISFVEGLGSLRDKIEREKNIALFLIQKYQDSLSIRLKEAESLVKETIELAKADLLSEMVYEFPELQGLMGYYYAKAEGRREEVCLAIKEQYLPVGEDSSLPSSLFSGIVAMANKLDNIFALFSVGKIPTGSKDPFALRRASVGIMRIALEYHLAFDLESDIKKIFEIGDYKAFDVKIISDFFKERLEGMIGLNPAFYRSVLGGNEREVNAIVLKVNSLSRFFENDDKESFVSTFKRVANITKDMQKVIKINESLFKEPKEIELYAAYKELDKRDFKDIDEEIAALFSLKKPLDEFFASVMVNDEDILIRDNRKGLIFSIYQKFLRIGDIKEIGF